MTSAPPLAETLCGQACAALKQRDIQQAIDLYEQAIAADPHYLPAKQGLATACFLVRDYDRAIDIYQQIFRMDPRKSEPLVNLGAIYNRQGKYQEAVKVLRQALGKNMRSPEAFYNLGIAQKGMNQLSLARSAYKEAIRIAPDMAEAHYNLANLLMEMGHFGQAKLSFERALQIRPNFEKAGHGLKRAQNQLSAAKEAVNPFGRLVNMDEVERRGAADHKFRTLSPQERFDDRSQVHRLSKESEQSAATVLNQLREELSPALLEMSRTMTEEEDLRSLLNEATHFKEALKRFVHNSSLLFQKLDELKSHEEWVRS